MKLRITLGMMVISIMIIILALNCIMLIRHSSKVEMKTAVESIENMSRQHEHTHLSTFSFNRFFAKKAGGLKV